MQPVQIFIKKNNLSHLSFQFSCYVKNIIIIILFYFAAKFELIFVWWNK
jgi:hypothetical protein